jgi:hypothetical protein
MFAPTGPQFDPKQLDRRGGSGQLFQLGLHGRSSTLLNQSITATAPERQVTFWQLRVRRTTQPGRFSIFNLVDDSWISSLESFDPEFFSSKATGSLFRWHKGCKAHGASETRGTSNAGKS